LFADERVVALSNTIEEALQWGENRLLLAVVAWAGVAASSDAVEERDCCCTDRYELGE
jgi:hypothetical protein